MKFTNFIYAGMIGAALLTACSDDDSTTQTPDAGNLSLNISGLEQLGPDFVYEGWVIVDGAPVSTGTFTSVTFPQTFNVDQATLDNASRFVLSIEPAVDPDPAPAPTKLLAGDFDGSSANLAVAPVTTNASDFSNIGGTLFLRTPTDEVERMANNGNDQYGIWFGVPGMPPTAGLDLPELAPGWVYEGWVVVEGSGPISTGTFTEFGAVDSGNPFSGTEYNVGPPIPGEDFFNSAPDGFTFPLDLRGRTAVISIEPSPDDSPAPFAIKPLLGAIGQETAPSTHDFMPNLSTLPTGMVSR